ncbi:MAG: DNA polymerase IV [Spirochaetales bacterium]|nr:DNA polymerase IV [Spirochaetales bacterium]
MSVYFHVDLDAFYASVEKLDNPLLEGKPVIVGGAQSHRGVVSTCSYEARAFGVRSAMPIAEARRRCPHAVFLPVRMSRYAEMSSMVMAIFDEFTPDVIRVSIDEASLDMSGTDLLWGSPEKAATMLQARVLRETGLSISIGVACNRYVAKVACGVRKPGGLLLVNEGEEAGFMLSLRLKDVWGAGAKTRARLEALGILTVEQLAALSLETLTSQFGKAGGSFLYRIARGVDPGIYEGEAASRSMSTETTYDQDMSDRMAVEATLLAMSEELMARMIKERTRSNCAVLKLRYANFETVSIRETRTVAIASSTALYGVALSLLSRKWDGRPLRLVGLGLARLEGAKHDDAPCPTQDSYAVGGGYEEMEQGELFSCDDEKQILVERAAFEAARKGLGKLTRARLVPSPEKRTSIPQKPS